MVRPRRLSTLVLAAALASAGVLAAPAKARAASAVFTGDPVDGGGTPYEILPDSRS